MSIKRLTQFITGIFHNPWGRVAILSIYYLAILFGLVVMYGRGNLSAPEFVYQGF